MDLSGALHSREQPDSGVDSDPHLDHSSSWLPFAIRAIKLRLKLTKDSLKCLRLRRTVLITQRLPNVTLQLPSAASLVAEGLTNIGMRGGLPLG